MFLLCVDFLFVFCDRRICNKFCEISVFVVKVYNGGLLILLFGLFEEEK